MRIRHVRSIISLFNDCSTGAGLVRRTCNIAVLTQSASVGVDNSTSDIAHTTGAISNLLPLIHGNRRLGRRRIECIVVLIGRKDSKTVRRLTNSGLYIATGKGPVGPGALNRGACIRTVTTGAIALNVNPTNANGACLTITVTIGTFHTGRITHVVLAHPTIRTKRGLNFLPNSVRDGISPCLQPLCSTLFSVLKTRACRQCLRQKSVRVTPLTCVQKHALSSDFVVLSRTRGAAPRRVGVFLAHLNFGSQVIIANSIARVSLPSNGRDNLGRIVGILGSIRSITVYAFDRQSIMQRRLIRHVVATCRRCRGIQRRDHPSDGNEGRREHKGARKWGRNSRQGRAGNNWGPCQYPFTRPPLLSYHTKTKKL